MVAFHHFGDQLVHLQPWKNLFLCGTGPKDWALAGAPPATSFKGILETCETTTAQKHEETDQDDDEFDDFDVDVDDDDDDDDDDDVEEELRNCGIEEFEEDSVSRSMLIHLPQTFLTR